MGNSVTEKTTVVDIEDIIDFYVKAYEVPVHRYEYYLDSTKGKVALVLTVDEEAESEMPKWLTCEHPAFFRDSSSRRRIDVCRDCGSWRAVLHDGPWMHHPR